ncbi:hypothetical protein LWI28_023432 [Acer negundo]|uniref:Uncharacterized protein n=1 Tax=Acer negundo TaxID=4023 RepID=A0AAD5JH04_ACENE|nr:hypothetical protein LWI28_023432 [Acer negundo]
MKLAQMYMERVSTELEFELVRNSDRESTQEALLLQGVHSAYSVAAILFDYSYLILASACSAKYTRFLGYGCEHKSEEEEPGLETTKWGKH